MASTHLLINGKWVEGTSRTPVLDKYFLKPFDEVGTAGPQDVDAAVSAAQAAFAMPFAPADRQEVLARAAALVEERRELLVRTIVQESGFTRSDANGEVTRAAITLRLSGEEAVRIADEMVPVQGTRGAEAKLAYLARHPIGVVCAITPFNAPLNTPAHKLGPAIAAGCPVVFKPSIMTPFTGIELARILQDAGLPAGWLNVVNGSGGTVGQQLLKDPRIAFYHFTGSTETGLQIRSAIGLRQAALELGNISTTIVGRDADLDAVARQCAVSAYRKAGQVCTSIQLILVERPEHARFLERFAAVVSGLKVGDPHVEGTEVGPLISLPEAERVETWINAAIGKGGRLVVGGSRENAVVQPTVLTDLSEDSPMVCREVFGPVASVLPVADIDEAIRRVNASPYGLAAGLFTNDLAAARRAAQTIRTGTLHINSTSSSRIDMMPFGGVKDSGNGKEGPHYAIREMMEERLIFFH